jgi:Surp module
VVPPEEDRLRHIIDTMALYVLDGGCAFEQAVMERGRGNPLFSFLFDLKSKEHTYYVWRLYSFAQVRILFSEHADATGLSYVHIQCLLLLLSLLS